MGIMSTIWEKLTGGGSSDEQPKPRRKPGDRYSPEDRPCPNCGGQHGWDVRVCPRSGRRISPPNEVYPKPGDPVQRFSIPTWAMYGAAGLVAAAAFVYLGGPAAVMGLAQSTLARGAVMRVAATGLAATAATASPETKSEPARAAGMQPRTLASAPSPVPAKKDDGLWQIVKIPNMGGFQGGGTYSIRPVADIERGISYASFRHGGLSRDPVKNLERVGGPTTRGEAVKRLASMIKPGSFKKPPLAAGTWGEIGGKLATIDDFGPVSIRELQDAQK